MVVQAPSLGKSRIRRDPYRHLGPPPLLLLLLLRIQSSGASTWATDTERVSATTDRRHEPLPLPGSCYVVGGELTGSGGGREAGRGEERRGGRECTHTRFLYKHTL